jgi:hypothetical protein
MLLVGGPGSGKTIALQMLLRQDLESRRGFLLIDPQGSLAKRTIRYAAYLNRKIAILDPSRENLITFNPLLGGDPTTTVDRVVDTLAKIFGAQNTDASPRLEKWLNAILTMATSLNLTHLDALEFLTNATARTLLIQKMPKSIQRNLLDELSALSPRDYFAQVESTVNRLRRIGPETASGLILGAGTDTLDLPGRMARGEGVVVNLRATLRSPTAHDRHPPPG